MRGYTNFNTVSVLFPILWLRATDHADFCITQVEAHRKYFKQKISVILTLQRLKTRFK